MTLPKTAIAASAIALPCLALPLPALAQAETLAPIVVTATAPGADTRDLPLSIDRLDQDDIQVGNPMVNLSETLNRVPGIVVRNRQNYAQDLQISSRGFGARATFGVRGVRLYVDGIPATMPDGQGQTSNFDLASAAHIDVLRGPFSALYGNSSGGVVSIYTEDGQPGLALSPFAQFGSWNTRRYGIKSAGEHGMLNHVLSINRFETDGYRAHSAARRDIANAKLRLVPGGDTIWTLVANRVSMPEVLDPLGLPREQMLAAPRSVHPNALLFNTRKSVRQQQLGMNAEHFLNAQDSLHLMAYGGQRDVLQFLAIPPAPQAAPTHSGGVVDLGRDFGGIDLRWAREAAAGWLWTAGLSVETVEEDRRGYENFIGDTPGVRGALRRNERNTITSIEQYAQAQWEPTQQWLLLAGVRHSMVRVRTRDRYVAPGNPDDSGAIRYRATNPVLGATWRATADLNVYASYGRGFETPTLNELSYRTSGNGAAGFNFSLRPATSSNIEVGIKAAVAQHWRLNLAAFHIDTRNELTVLSSAGGRAVFQNAASTRRRGLELGVEGRWDNGLGILLSASLLDARYADRNGATTFAGNRLPGVPARTGFAELSWRAPQGGFSTALELQHVGRVYVNDANSEAADAYTIANARIGFEQQIGGWTLREFLRVDNLANRRHVGSVIVNEGNGRFYEPGPGRHVLVGVTASHAWK
ncbi:MAG TPA: TonB-dependent receptor [Noviherbaspirillum sp.]|nr:TonB-dependent receptor [Noviherbaspirillum sp.]